MCVSPHGLMNMDIICSVCSGRKEILGLGSIKKKCIQCEGTGFIKKEQSNDTSTEHDNKSIKKLGRPKKVQ